MERCHQYEKDGKLYAVRDDGVTILLNDGRYVKDSEEEPMKLTPAMQWLHDKATERYKDLQKNSISYKRYIQRAKDGER